ARSVAKWTHKHFTRAGFSDWQAKQGRKGGIAKGIAYNSKREASKKLREAGMSVRDIASIVGASKSAVAAWTSNK
ncbi:plasmid replication protein, partial [Pseudoalteromonas sp. Cn5-37]|uniref:hypothetical protein n=1 Tax=Pseudoalteromonas sp. Cn5-37 TaxID=2908886 RepID=UPI003FA7C68E|nr:plasmid replication protein [Pseudoalteromonas sp. Cn5-37]